MRLVFASRSPHFVWGDAVSYCNGLEYAGNTDWRLPTLGDLRGLIEGCSATETGGECGVTDDCLEWSCYGEPMEESPCLYPCFVDEGPAGGCYWPSNLEGNCGAYWASQEDPDSSELALSVFFDDGMISSMNKEMEKLYVRCVREAK